MKTIPFDLKRWQKEKLEELLRVIKDRIAWCTRTKTIDADYLESNFGKELLRKYGIYTSGAHDISVDNIVEIILLGSASATVEAWDNASATVGQYHSSNLKYSLGDGDCPLIKHLTERKIYVKTSDFEIVQVHK